VGAPDEIVERHAVEVSNADKCRKRRFAASRLVKLVRANSNPCCLCNLRIAIVKKRLQVAETIFRFKQGILTTFHAYDKSREVNPMYHVNPPDIENRVKYTITTRRTRKRL
jgi:hypothetical protein